MNIKALLTTFVSLGLTHVYAATTFSADNQSLRGSHLNTSNGLQDIGSGTLTSGNNSNNPASPSLFNSILVFNVSAIPDNQVITNATLTMVRSNTFGSGHAFSLDVYVVGYSSSSTTLPSEAVFKDNDVDGLNDGIRISNDLINATTTGNQSVSGASFASALNAMRPATGSTNNFVFFRINNDAPARTDIRNSIAISNTPGFPTLSITYDTIPEPSTSCFGLIGTLALLRRRRNGV